MGSYKCLYARAEGVLEICSATLVLHLDLDGLEKHHEHFGACNLGCLSVGDSLQKELDHASPNRPRRFPSLLTCLCNTCRNRTYLRSKIAEPHTEVQGGAVSSGMPKSPAFVTSYHILDTLDAVDVLSMFAPLPQHSGILYASMISAPCVYNLSSGEPRFPYKLYRVITTTSHPPQAPTTAGKPLPTATAAELTLGHCSGQSRQSSVFASTAEVIMSADTSACRGFISFCSHLAFPQVYSAFGRWKWVLQMYFVHFVFLHIKCRPMLASR